MTVETFTNIIHKANGDGSTKDFNLSFSTYEADDVFVYLWDTSTDKYVLQSLTTHYTQSGSKISFVTAPPSPPSADFENIFIIRKTDLLNPKTTFQAGSSIRAADLNNNQTQLINALQERLHLSPDILFPEFEGNLDMNGHKIKNIGTPSASTDVSTKAYVDTAIDSITAAGASPPDSPSAGDRWYDTGTGRTYVYYTDTDSSAWVEASPPLHSGSGVDASSGNALPLAGGTMTGTLTLSGAPTANLHAATKAYVDAQNTGASSVPLDGSSKMTGDLTLDNQKGVKFEEASGNNYVYLRGNNSVASDYTLTLPNAVPGTNDYRLVSDTSGNLSWAAPSNTQTGLTNTNIASGAGIDATKLSYTASGTGANARTIDKKLDEVRSVTDFGALTTASAADNAAAFQEAITACADVCALYVPTGTYQISSTLSIADKCLTIYGDGPGLSILEFTGGTDGLQFTSTSNFKYLNVRNIAFRANGYRNGSPITASYTPDPAVLRQTVILENVHATKTNASSSWICGFYFNNCSWGRLDKVVFNGRKQGSSDSSYGFRFKGTGEGVDGSNDVYVTNCAVNNCEGPGYWIDGVTEDVTIENCITVSNTVGIRIEGPDTDATTKGFYTIQNCNIDDKTKGIESKNAEYTKFIGNTIRADSNSSTGTQNWVGLDLHTDNNDNVIIANNHFVGRTTNAGSSTDIGIQLDHTNHCLIENNLFHNVTKGIKTISSNSGNVTILHNKLKGATLPNFLDNTGNVDSIIQMFTAGAGTDDVLKIWNTNTNNNTQLQVGSGNTDSTAYMNVGVLAGGTGQIVANQALECKGTTSALLQGATTANVTAGTSTTITGGTSAALTGTTTAAVTGGTTASVTAGTDVAVTAGSNSGNKIEIKAPAASGLIDIDASGTGGNVKIQSSANDGQIEFWTNDAGNTYANIQKATYTDDGRFLWRWTTPGNTVEYPRHEVWGGPAPSIGCFNNDNSSTQRNQIIFYNNNGDNTSGRNGYGIVGTITANNSSTVYNTSSDYRLKENVVGLTGAIARVKSLTPYRFNFKASPGVTVDGFMAHEAQTVVPEAVTGVKDGTTDIGTLKDKDGKVLKTNVGKPPELDFGKTWEKTGTTPEYQGIDQAKLVPLLTAALQEALTEIDTLKNRVTALEG